MTDQPEPLGPDELATRWLEDGPQPLADTDSPSVEQDETGRRRLAELQLLHGLLSHLHDQDAIAREARVQKVLHALNAPANVLPFPAQPAPAARRPGRSRVRRILSVLASSAAVLLVVLLAWKMSGGNPAYAVMTQAISAAGQERDRTYHVVDRWGRPELTREATLYVRGDQFVFRPQRPLIPGLLLGSDGRQGWAVRALGPVLVTDDPLAFYRVMAWGLLPRRADDPPPEQKALPLLQLRTLLERLGRSYRLELLAAESLPELSSVAYKHLRAQRQENVVGGSEVVDLWVHPDTGVLGRIRFQTTTLRGERVVTLDLVSEEPLASNWYEHSAHHASGRPVKHWLPAEQLPPDAVPPDPDGKP